MAKPIPHSDRVPTWMQENLPPELVASTLFRFKVKLQASTSIDGEERKEIEVNLLPDLDLDYEHLEDQMYQIPAVYSFWSAVYSEVRLAVAIAERKLKARRTEVTDLIVKEAAANKVRLTDATIKSLADGDKRLNEAELRFQHAQMQAGKLYNQLEALKMKAELARSLLGLKKQDRDNTQ
jgi:hypothetical protein